jgi:hypothetical protein
MLILLVKSLPDSFPGAGFKRTARHWRGTLTDLAERPYAFVRHQMARGKHEPSYVSKLFEQGNLNLSPEEDFVAKWTAASLYSGGADTVCVTLVKPWLVV